MAVHSPPDRPGGYQDKNHAQGGAEPCVCEKRTAAGMDGAPSPPGQSVQFGRQGNSYRRFHFFAPKLSGPR